ncbi:60Kd inner membrane protein-domain-containing protein [Tribonema minus]|uniref:60Kd inner membrane protein-domain-containing protein n=1 Tax=Tribonema minus TaxID=303371 RepID=A0A836CB90_9STRA|nr:60Kd inner membrane protein-domain-containing protein [Tribonema minus]
MMLDPVHLHHTVSSVLDVDQSWLSHVASGIADATAAVQDGVDGVVQAKKDDWFAQFVNQFEAIIKGIDAGYEKIGIQNAFGLSIVTFTVLVKTVLLPLNFLQLQSAEKMQQITPVQKKIAEMYPDDKATQQIIVSRLYEQTKVNPLAGCLPSFAQIPVFIGLYRSLQQLAAENVVNEPFLWIPNLQGPVFDKGRGVQWLTENWVGLTPSLGWADTIAYCSIPILLVLSQSISMKMLSPPVDPKDESAMRTQQVLKYLPLMIGWFSLQVPAALGVYWMTNNIVSTTATQSIKAYLKANPPQLDIPEDILKPAQKSGLPSLEQAILEARINARPSRLPRRMV